MTFPTLLAFKSHINIEQVDLEFDRQLSYALSASKNKVLSYVNRKVYEVMPEEPELTDILLDDSINFAILDLAGYYFDNKGNLDNHIINSILESTVGHLRLTSL